jgi:hypothetical protein
MSVLLLPGVPAAALLRQKLKLQVTHLLPGDRVTDCDCTALMLPPPPPLLLLLLPPPPLLLLLPSPPLMLMLLLLLLLLLPQCVPGRHQGHPDICGKGAAAGPCKVCRQPSGLLLLRSTSWPQLQDRVGYNSCVSVALLDGRECSAWHVPCGRLIPNSRNCTDVCQCARSCLFATCCSLCCRWDIPEALRCGECVL